MSRLIRICSDQKGLTRREFLYATAIGTAIGAGFGAAGSVLLGKKSPQKIFTESQTEIFIAKAAGYHVNFSSIISRGLAELGITQNKIRGKRVFLKPNLVEVRPGTEHINTHPLVVQGAVEAFLRLGAKEVLVGEGTAHNRDSLLVYEESGLSDVLYEDKIQFLDLNNGPIVKVSNESRFTELRSLSFPEALARADFIVSMPKMKTHHWAGVTLSMKNMFGVMPGIVYGWPKNVLHTAGIDRSILDINYNLKPDLAIVDGVIGMEGDGPIMGTPRKAGLLVIGRNFPAVDATCSRLMGINPDKVSYLRVADGTFGTIDEQKIEQRGETIRENAQNFYLKKDIPIFKHLSES